MSAGGIIPPPPLAVAYRHTRCVRTACQEKGKYFEKENNGRLWDQEICALLFETITKIPGYATGLGHNITYVVLNLPTNFGLPGIEFGSGLIGLPVRKILNIYCVTACALIGLVTFLCPSRRFYIFSDHWHHRYQVPSICYTFSSKLDA